MGTGQGSSGAFVAHTQGSAAASGPRPVSVISADGLVDRPELVGLAGIVVLAVRFDDHPIPGVEVGPLAVDRDDVGSGRPGEDLLPMPPAADDRDGLLGRL